MLFCPKTTSLSVYAYLVKTTLNNLKLHYVAGPEKVGRGEPPSRDPEEGEREDSRTLLKGGNIISRQMGLFYSLLPLHIQQTG